MNTTHDTVQDTMQRGAYYAQERAAYSAEYSGHAANSGLQKHSIGEDYPYIIFGVEDYGNKSKAERLAAGEAMPPLEWRIMHAVSGSESKNFPTYALAAIEVASLKLRDMMHG